MFLKDHEIPLQTFYDHVNKNDEKRIDVVSGVGPPKLLFDTAPVILDVLVRKDRANDGIGVTGAVELLGEMNPDLSMSQIRNAFFHMRKTDKGFLHRVTNHPVVAQV